MIQLVSDFRFATRMLRKHPGVAAVVALTFALGIGATTCIFSFVHAILLAPLPYPDADRLVTVWQDASRQGGLEREWFSFADYRDYRSQTPALADLAAFGGWQPTLTGDQGAAVLTGAAVTHSFFTLLGTPLAAGRSFTPAEDAPGAPSVVVVTRELAARLFGDPQGALAGTLRLDGEPYSIVGVLPAGFAFPMMRQVEVFRPLRIDPAIDDRGNFYLHAVGRLRPGVGLDQARHDLAAVARRIAAENPDSHRDIGATAYPLGDDAVRGARTPLLVLLGAVGLLLLIACVNVANLLLARASSRRAEMAIRASLGAGRGRLVRQLLIESSLLAAAGSIVGVSLAMFGVDLLRDFLAAHFAVPRLAEVAVDPAVLAFATGLTALTGLAFGLAPALAATRSAPAHALQAGRGGGELRSGGRLRSGLIVAEVAIAVTLLAGSALLLRSFARLIAVDPGFESRGVLTFSLNAPAAGYPERPQVASLFRDLTAKLAGLPGVTAAAAVSALPFGSNYTDVDFTVEGRPEPPPGSHQTTGYRQVTPGYFATLRLPVLRGRPFSPPTTPRPRRWWWSTSRSSTATSPARIPSGGGSPSAGGRGRSSASPPTPTPAVSPSRKDRSPTCRKRRSRPAAWASSSARPATPSLWRPRPCAPCPTSTRRWRLPGCRRSTGRWPIR